MNFECPLCKNVPVVGDIATVKAHITKKHVGQFHDPIFVLWPKCDI